MNAAEKRATSLRCGGIQLRKEGVVPQRDGGVLPVGRPSTRTKLAAETADTKLGRKLFVFFIFFV